MSGETLTPNIGLQVPGYDQGNWQVPTNYNWTLLDLLLGGQQLIENLDVENLTVQNFTISNLAALLAGSLVAQAPAGAVPGTVYTLTAAPAVMIGLYLNGLFLRPGLDYTLTGNQLTLGVSTSSGDTLFAVYFQ